jgi:hypothetical protein
MAVEESLSCALIRGRNTCSTLRPARRLPFGALGRGLLRLLEKEKLALARGLFP